MLTTNAGKNKDNFSKRQNTDFSKNSNTKEKKKQPPKPSPLPVFPENIPPELKAIDQWVCWKYQFRKGKWTKPPFQAGNKKLAKPDDPSTWGTFKEAIKAYQEGGFDGIGIMLSPETGLVGFDFDHCIKGEEISPEVQGFIRELKSYAEISPGADGARALAWGRKPGEDSKNPQKGYECYSSDRYLTITGQIIEECRTIRENQKGINAIYQKIWPPKKEKQPQKRETQGGERTGADLNDDELLDLMFGSKNGSALQDLWRGDISSYGSHSEADLKLCGALAFWTGNDGSRINSLFRRSGLMRDKWDGKHSSGGETYGEITIRKAIANNSDVFERRGDHKGQNRQTNSQGIPFGFEIDQKGNLFKTIFDNKGKPLSSLFLCSPLNVLAHTRTKGQSGWGLLLKWRDLDGHIHRWAAPKSAMVAEGIEVCRELADRGLKMNPSLKARRYFLEYLNMVEVEGRIICTDSTGWHEGVFVFPDRCIGSAEKQFIFQSEKYGHNPYEVSGNLSEWRENVSSLCRGNSRLILGLSTAFASSLLCFSHDENGGIHFVGSSSCGKTTAGTVAGSVFGGEAMKQNWNSTANALGATAINFNDTLMILDELSQVDGKTAGETAYLLANGTEKGRADRTGAMKERRRWRLLFLSNGEIDLAQHLQADGKIIKAGQDVRLLTIPADAGQTMGIFENLNGFQNPAALADELKSNSSKYYGTAGPEFIERISKDHKEIEKRISQLRSEFLNEHLPKDAESQARRAAARFALIAIAGEMATAYGITGWEAGEAEKAAATCFKSWMEWRGGITNHEERAFLSHIREHFERYGESRYTRIPDDMRIINDRFGFREATGKEENGTPRAYDYFVLPEIFSKEICNGFERGRMIDLLEKMGMLSIGNDGKKSITKNLPGMGKGRCYHIKGDVLFNES